MAFQKFVHFLIFFINFPTPQVLHASLAQAEHLVRTVDCIDRWEDLKTLGWSPNLDSESYLKYAETSIDLPAPSLQGKLSGQGLFWYSNFLNRELGCGFQKQINNLSDLQPINLYMSYYTHRVNQMGQQVVAFTTTKRLYKHLPLTRDLVWGEAWTELTNLQDTMISLPWCWNFEAGDVFIIDKIVVTQRINVTSVEHIKNLCSFESTMVENQTDESSTELPSTTTDGGFFCREVGYFPDPTDCTRYHSCQYNGNGELVDELLTCHEPLVWCQETYYCQSPDFCPCPF